MSAILIISPEPWDTNQVSKHHYARTLARRGHKVFFVDPPGSSGSKISIEKVVGEEGEIFIVRGPRVAPGLRFMPRPLRRALERRWLAQLERNVGAHIDIVWLFENSRFYDMSFAGDRVKIYHQVDLDQSFHQAEAASSADACFAVGDMILSRLSEFSSVVVKIAHGVLIVGPEKRPEQSLRRPGRTAVACIGNLDRPCFDLDILAKVVAGSPEVDFHLIGGFSESGRFHSQFTVNPNVFTWGRLPSRELPSVLAIMDAHMIVYDTTHYFEQSTNPHKLMEYFASGKVAVATYTDEYKSLAGSLVVMVDQPSDYPAAFRAVMADLDRWNAPELRAARIAYALDNTYDRQVDRISSALAQCEGIRGRLGDIRL